MSRKCKVAKIVLDIGGDEVVLNLEQAEDLYKELGELFGERMSRSLGGPVIYGERADGTGPLLNDGKN